MATVPATGTATQDAASGTAHSDHTWPVRLVHTDDDERTVVGSVLEHGTASLSYVGALRGRHFGSWVHGAAFDISIVLADQDDPKARVMGAGERFRRLPPGYDLSWCDATDYAGHATLVAPTVAFHAGRIREGYGIRSALSISVDIQDRLERGHSVTDVATDAAGRLLELAKECR